MIPEGNPGVVAVQNAGAAQAGARPLCNPYAGRVGLALAKRECHIFAGVARQDRHARDLPGGRQPRARRRAKRAAAVGQHKASFEGKVQCRH